MNDITIIKKKSTEFNTKEIEQIYEIYTEVFHEKRDVNFFYDQFCNTYKGYSYHAIAVQNDKIVGHNVYVPFKYIAGNKPFMLVLSIDAMIHPDFQGKGLYKKLLKACEEMALEEGCKIRIGFPNENSYPIQKKAFNYHEFGKLDIYILPLKLGKFKSVLKFLDPIINWYAKYRTSKISSDSSIFSPYCKRDKDSFDKERYKWFGGKYNIIELEHCIQFVYRKFVFKGIPAIFLMDVYPMNAHAFETACNYIVTKESEYPFLLYVGNLPFKQKSLIRVPEKLKPKDFHFVGKILDPDFFSEAILDINNWDINLSSFDLL